MDGYVVIGTELNTKSFDAQIDYIEKQMEEIEYKIKQADMGFEVGDTEKLQNQYEKLGNQLIDLKKKQADINKADLSNINKSVEKVGETTSKITKKIGKMALAIFGIRSAYMAVRSAINTIAGDDEQLKADIDYMKDAIAYVLEPVVRKVVELAKQLLLYIGYIVQLWTGKNIFENANKSLKNANKNAKDLRKTMAGFDEMNVLGSGGASSGGGTVAPSFDLSEVKNADLSGIYSWIDKVIKIFDVSFEKIKENVKKVMGDLGFSEDFIFVWEFAVDGVKKIFDGLLQSIKGILEIIVGLISGDVEKVKEGVSTLIKGIGNMLLGLLKTIVGILGMTLTTIFEFFNELKNKIVNLFKTIGTKVGEVIAGAFKAVINGVLKVIENMLNAPIKSINKLINVINDVPGIDLKTLPTFKLPRLAVGGIVNMPSRGVPIGGAIAGEAGAEGVIPLTNSQAMETLGQAIGKYINVNLTNITKLDNRQIAREQKKINAQSDFAFNR